MALSAGVSWTLKGGAAGSIQFPVQVKSAAVVYNGALVSFETLSGAVIPFDGGSTDVLCGWHFGDTVTGDGTATKNARICTGPFIGENVSLGGTLNNSTADLGRIVYATDDGTYTVASGGAQVGRIVAYKSAGVFDVLFRYSFGRYGTTTGGA
jgi:hypothetical protein